MGSTTFSGPIKAGTILSTTGTTIGTDIKNTGQVVMAQSAAFAYSDTSVTATNIVIPANSQIIDIVIDVEVAFNGGGVKKLDIGKSGGLITAFLNTYDLAGTVGRKYPTTEAGGALIWADVGATDVKVTFQYTDTGGGVSAGNGYFTFLYQQNLNLK
jgi:hypothetical protein|tara:strand:+ start:2729 stop:3199 length:471 start_codon:yes stop_codon:yes gene_type:complete